jgi:signal transduction histidine kinase
MANSVDKSQQSRHRDRTDQSLSIERNKTNDSIDKTRRQAEEKTDLKVESERIAADSQTRADRKTTDAKRDREGFQQDGAQLHEERKTSDYKLERERVKADAAINKERDEVDSATIEFLKRERGQTDANLKNERDEEDLHSVNIMKNLSTEVSEHLKTKVSVTSRDELIAILSHDLRNPIGTISATAELLADDSEQDDKKKWVDIIKRNADRALQLIEDIFAMENIAQGKFKLKLEKQSLKQLLAEVVDTSLVAARGKSLTLKLEIPEDDADVVFDYARMMQVLSNVVGNAVKFTLPGGTVTVGMQKKGNDVLIFVRDNGPGIPESKRKIIFNRFSQIGSKDRAGLGLGLYIAKIFIEAHHGQIWVEPAKGGGSVFYISLSGDFGAKAEYTH